MSSLVPAYFPELNYCVIGLAARSTGFIQYPNCEPGFLDGMKGRTWIINNLFDVFKMMFIGVECLCLLRVEAKICLRASEVAPFLRIVHDNNASIFEQCF